MTEYGVLVDDESPRASRGALRWLLVVVGGVVALALIATSVVSFQAAQKSEARIAQLESQVTELSKKQTEIGAKVVPLPDALEVLAARIAKAESAAESAQSTADSASNAASEASARGDDIAQCVNDYMKTVGDAGGGSYRYFFC